MKKSACLLLAALCLCMATRAQGPDTAAIKAVVSRLFDAMRTGDTARIRALFRPGVALQTVANTRDGKTVLQTDPLDSFLAAVARPHTQTYDERIRFGDIKVDGSLAMVWAPYEFFLGEQFSHCGVDVFHLMKTDGEWKIIFLVDTRRRQGCR